MVASLEDFFPQESHKKGAGRDSGARRITREMRSSEGKKLCFCTTHRKRRAALIAKSLRRTRRAYYLLSATDGLAPKSRRPFAAVRAARAEVAFAAAVP